MFPVKDTAELESLYPGLTAVETKQLVAYQPPVSGFGCELAMVEVADAADAETVRAIFQQRVDSIANDDAYPENAPAWKNNSAVTVNGNYVVLGIGMAGTFSFLFRQRDLAVHLLIGVHALLRQML